jgi:hypothetical protein
MKPNVRLAILMTMAAAIGACSGNGDSAGSVSTPDTRSISTETDAPATTTATTQATTVATTAAQPEVAAVDPCALLDAGDLDAATGLTFGDGTFNDALSNEEFAICDWITTGSEYATAQVMVSPGGDYDLAKEDNATIASLADVSVPGADAAFMTEEGSIVGMNVDGTYIQVAYIPPGPGNVGDITTQLAALALTRLE